MRERTATEFLDLARRSRRRSMGVLGRSSARFGMYMESDPFTDAPWVLRVGQSLEVAGLGALIVRSVSQRNWSRVGIAECGGDRYFVKQFIDRVGGRHDKGFVGDKRSLTLLGECVGDFVRVVPVLGEVPERLIVVSPFIPMETLDSIGRAGRKHGEHARMVGRALADIFRARTIAESDGTRVAVWKGLDPKNLGWTDDGDLWLFDVGPPVELAIDQAAARVVAAGLLSRWVARPGLHVIWPERAILDGVSAPLLPFTTYPLVSRELDKHVELRLREPQRSGVRKVAVRLGLRTVGKIHWRRVRREARRLFEAA